MLIELLPSQDEPHPTDWERNYALRACENEVARDIELQTELKGLQKCVTFTCPCVCMSMK